MRRSTSERRLAAWTGALPAIAAQLVLAGAPIGLAAQELANNSAALFLWLPVGAQAAAMGQTAVALGGRGEAAFWNPAGLAMLERNEIAYNTATVAVGATHALTAYFPARGAGVLGAAVYLVDYGELDRTDSSSNTIGRIAPRNLELLTSYAATLGGTLSLGINYKVVEFTVNCSGDCTGVPGGQSVTHALDLGGQMAVGPARALRVGVALRNVGVKAQGTPRDQPDALPARLVVGALCRIVLPGAAGLEGDDRLDLRLAADVDRPWGGYGDSQMRLGVDVGYQELVRLRGGYAFVRDGLSGPSFGMGVTSGSIGVDLARTFLIGSDLMVQNPTFFSFRVAF